MEHQNYQAWQKGLNLLLLLCALLYAMAWYRTTHFIAHDAVLPALRQDPVQMPTEEQPFSFQYAGWRYEVQPVADYELWGLVVSHNNIHGLGDIYHSKDAVDTKDLCVIWGDNLGNDDFHRVKYSSGPWTCYYSYPEGVSFRGDQMSNNHIVTDSADLRRALASVRIGDQIQVRGQLVNYRDMRHPEFWRKSSTVRTDQGNGACEVVFIRDLRVLQRHVPGWYNLRDHLPLAALFLMALKVLITLVDPGYRRPVASRIGGEVLPGSEG